MSHKDTPVTPAFSSASNGAVTLDLGRALSPPADENYADVLHGIRVADPFRPLENYTDAAVIDWAVRQSTRFENFVAPTQALQDKTFAFLQAAVPDGVKESMPQKAGDRFFVWKKKKEDQRYALFLKDVPDYGAPARLLLDPAAIDPSGKTDIAGVSFTPDGKTMAYQLSVSGSDRTTLKFMDVATGTPLDLTYTEFHFGIDWDADGQGFRYLSRLEDIRSYEVRHHKMGEDPSADTVICTPSAPETMYWPLALKRDSTRAHSRYDIIHVGDTDPDKNAILIRPAGSEEKFTEIFPKKEGALRPFHEMNGKIYATTTLGAPKGRVVRFDPADPAPEKWETIIPEHPTDPMNNAEIWRGRLLAYYSHDTGDKVTVSTPEGDYIHDLPIPALSTVSFTRNDPDDQTVYLKVDNFQEDGAVYRYDIDTDTLTPFKASDTPINLKDCIVERVHAPSKDGTLVPMTVIRQPGTILDGTAATLLYGYGGFNVPLNPDFSSGIAAWVREGGIYVMANLRGGGEFGQEWYDAGRLDKKQNVFDDFIGCAEHLIKNAYTSKDRLAIQGGSNGGLLTLATVLQRPDLFGAVISEVPVADMTRFHVGSEFGYGWKCDYGDPDNADDLKIQLSYSPLHNVPHGLDHPPVMIKPDMTDVRVLPWHSYKMAATLQAKESPGSQTYLCVLRDGGHGGGMTQDQHFRNTALIHGFLQMTLGPINQMDYKATVKPGQTVARTLTPP